jgi:hypothetical protein
MGDPSIRVTIRTGTSTRIPDARDGENVLVVQPRNSRQRNRRDIDFIPLFFWYEESSEYPTVPIVPRTKRCTHQENGTNCRICFNDVVTNDTITDLPCGHIFHKDCMDRWTEFKQECPLCRGPLNFGLTHSLSG